MYYNNLLLATVEAANLVLWGPMQVVLGEISHLRTPWH